MINNGEKLVYKIQILVNECSNKKNLNSKIKLIS